MPLLWPVCDLDKEGEEMKKTYCDICHEEIHFNPLSSSTVRKQQGFSFLDVHVDTGRPNTYLRIGAIPSDGHTGETCKECWCVIKVKIAQGKFTLSVNHTPVYREDSP